MRFTARGVGMAVGLVFVLGLVGTCTTLAIESDIADGRKLDLWKTYAFGHCRLIDLGEYSSVAYHCEDGHDYVQWGIRAPENWVAK